MRKENWKYIAVIAVLSLCLGVSVLRYELGYESYRKTAEIGRISAEQMLYEAAQNAKTALEGGDIQRNIASLYRASALGSVSVSSLPIPDENAEQLQMFFRSVPEIMSENHAVFTAYAKKLCDYLDEKRSNYSARKIR